MTTAPNTKISFCTVCMNRVHHLKETLPQNIYNNQSYNNLEFVILDYNSNDGMDSWVKDNFRNEIEAGRLHYFKTYEPTGFKMAHSKNMASRLATGDVVSVIDADNFTGENYADYINACFMRNDKIFITSIAKRHKQKELDVLGRICFKKADFTTISGYDEFMNDYGYDDFDIVNRLEMTGLKRIVLNNPKFLRSIKHTISDRIANQNIVRELQALFVSHISPGRSVFLYLFKNGRYSYGNVTDKLLIRAHLPSNILRPFRGSESLELKPVDWIRGYWKITGNSICLIEDGGKKMNIGELESGKIIMKSGLEFCKINDEAQVESALYLLSVLANLNRMRMNYNHANVVVNNDYGTGIVYKNFDSSKAIQL